MKIVSADLIEVMSDEFCCKRFEEYLREYKFLRRIVNQNSSFDSYFLQVNQGDVELRIDYCPWCAQQIPWKEKS